MCGLKMGTDPLPEVWYCIVCLLFIYFSFEMLRHAMAQLVEALRYNPEGRGLDSRWGYWNFSLT
jgi:hypothetical protein